jgi:hypothetical protein
MSALSSRLISIGSWLIFLAAWLTLLVQLFISWKVMSVDLHYDVVTLLVLLGALWGRLAPDKGREPELLSLSLTTAIV